MNGNKESKQNTFRDLLVWQKGMGLAIEACRLAASFPQAERTGLRELICRTAVGVPSGLADGYSRHGSGEFLQAVSGASGALSALETQIRIAVELQCCAATAAAPLYEMIDSARRVLYGLRRSMQSRTETGR